MELYINFSIYHRTFHFRWSKSYNFGFRKDLDFFEIQ